jgi:hypothetical protein
MLSHVHDRHAADADCARRGRRAACVLQHLPASRRDAVQEASGQLPAQGHHLPVPRLELPVDRRTGARGLGRPSAPRADDQETALYPIALREWQGFVYVNLGEPERCGFGTNFNANVPGVSHWPLAQLAVGHRLTRRIQCNWKIFWENYNECLHCPGVTSRTRAAWYPSTVAASWSRAMIRTGVRTRMTSDPAYPGRSARRRGDLVDRWPLARSRVSHTD